MSTSPASPLTISRAFHRPAPAMMGMPIRKANRAAASRFRPRNRPAAMVMPLRLMPGKSASAWATPMKAASP